MKLVETIRKVLDHDQDGVQLRGVVDAVVAVNVDERHEPEHDTDRPVGQEESND